MTDTEDNLKGKTNALHNSMVDLALALYKDIDSLAWDLLAEKLTQNIIYERPGYTPFIGKEAVMNFYRHERIIENGIHKIDKHFTQGNEVICLGSFSGFSKDNKQLSVDFVDHHLFNDTQTLLQKRKTFFFVPAI